MAKDKKNKLSTPEWILEGYESEEEYNKSKGVAKKEDDSPYKIKVCPKCESEEIGVVIGEKGVWECKKCGYKGAEVKKKGISEEEYFKKIEDIKFEEEK